MVKGWVHSLAPLCRERPLSNPLRNMAASTPHARTRAELQSMMVPRGRDSSVERFKEDRSLHGDEIFQYKHVQNGVSIAHHSVFCIGELGFKGMCLESVKKRSANLKIIFFREELQARGRRQVLQETLNYKKHQKSTKQGKTRIIMS